MTQTEATLYYREIDSPIGPLVLAASVEGLCAIQFGAFKDIEAKLTAWANRWFGSHRMLRDEPFLEPFVQQLTQYFEGERVEFQTRLDLRGTEFQKKVWGALLQIPYGKTASYKDIAEAIDSPKAVRAVGGANNRNPIAVLVPCHRVIGASGGMVGYGGGLDVKIRLLDMESEKPL